MTPNLPSKAAYGVGTFVAVSAWLSLACYGYFCADDASANYNGTAISMMGLAAVLTTLSISFSVRSIDARAKAFHETALLNQVRPMLRVHCSDFDDDIGVQLINDGLGPACDVVVEARRLDISTAASTADLLDLLPDSFRSVTLADFTINGPPEVIPKGGSVWLIRWRPPAGHEEWDVNVLRDQIRDALASVALTVTYTDLFGTKNLPAAGGGLTPFVRHTPPS